MHSDDMSAALRSPAEMVSAAAGAHVDSVPPHDLVVQLFDQLNSRLLLYVRSFGLPKHDSEDVLQETFLSLFQHLAHGRSRENLHGWLFRVAHNLALKRRSAIHGNGWGVMESASTEQRDFAPTPHDLLEFKQTQSLYSAVLLALPEQDRCCLLLRAEGLKYREIAALVGMSLGSVANSISRSLARLMRAAER